MTFRRFSSDVLVSPLSTALISPIGSPDGPAPVVSGVPFVNGVIETVSPDVDSTAYVATYSPNFEYVGVNELSGSQDMRMYKDVSGVLTEIAFSSPAAGFSRANAWSPDNTYFVSGGANSPYAFMFKRSGDTFTAITSPAGVGYAIYSTAWDGTGEYLAIGRNRTVDGLLVYKQVGDTFTPLTVPTIAGTAEAVAWSPDGIYLTVLYNTSPYFTILKRTGDTFAAITTPVISVRGRGADWTSDGVYMAISLTAAPFVILYKRSGDTFTAQTAPYTPPLSDPFRINWSPDDKYLSGTGRYTETLICYELVGDQLVKIAGPTAMPPEFVYATDFNADNDILVGKSATLFLSNYMSGQPTPVTGPGIPLLGGKLTNPVTLPGGTGRGVAWSPDAALIAVGHDVAPYFSTYKVDGFAMTKIADPATLPTARIRGVGWNGDSSSVAVGSDATPFMLVYNRVGDVLTKIADPAVLPVGGVRSVSFSDDGVYLAAVNITTSPYMQIYKRAGDVLTKLTNPATIPTGNCWGTAFSPDGIYLAISHSGSPFVSIYKRTGDSFVKLANPASLPAGPGLAVAWSPDGTLLAVAHTGTPFITVYSRSGDVFTKVADPASLPASTGRGVGWSLDNRYLAVAHSNTPWMAVYDFGSGALVKLADPAIIPSGTGFGASFSGVDNSLAIVENITPWLNVYYPSTNPVP